MVVPPQASVTTAKYGSSPDTVSPQTGTVSSYVPLPEGSSVTAWTGSG